MEGKNKKSLQDKSEFIYLAIKQNIADKEDSDNIIDIMNKIKTELDEQLDLTTEQVMTLNQIVQELLKEEDIFKPKKD